MLLPQYRYTVMLPFAVVLLFTLLYRPYKQSAENYRSLANQVCLLMVLSYPVFMKYSGNITNSPAGLLYLLCVFVGLLLNVLVGLGCFLFYLVYICYLKPRLLNT